MESESVYNQPLLGAIKAYIRAQAGQGGQRTKDAKKLVEYMVDDDFKRAMDFIIATSQKTGYHYDIHDENIMIRRTSTGAQMVISDPLGFSKQ